MIARARITPIGVDISGRHVRAVQLVEKSGRLSIHAATIFARLDNGTTPPETEAVRLAGVLWRQGFSGSDIILGLPEDRLLTTVIALPPRASGAPIEQIAAAEVGRIFKKDAATLELQLWELPSSARQAGPAQCMAMACPHEAALPLINAFEEAELTVRAIEPRALAMVRACRTHLAPEPGSTFIVDLGWDAAHMAVVCQGLIGYQRRLDGGEFSALLAPLITNDASSALDSLVRIVCPAADAAAAPALEPHVQRALDRYLETLAEQLRLSVEYVAHRFPAAKPARVLLIGEHARTRSLVERLGRTLGGGLEVSIVTPADVATIPARYSTVREAAMTALGLALFREESAA